MDPSLSPSPAAQQMLSQLDAPYRPKPTAFPVSLPRLYQSASALLSQARIYHREGVIEHAYLLYRRFMHLVLHSIRQHPQYGLKRFAAEKEQYRLLGHQAMDALEQLRKEIILKYQDLPLLQPDDDDDAQQEQHSAAAEEERKEAGGGGQAEVRGDALDAALQQRMSALLLPSEDQREEERKDDGHDTLSDSLPSAYRPPSPPSQSLLASAFTLSPTAEPSAPPLDDLTQPSRDAAAASATASMPWQGSDGSVAAVGVVDSSNRYRWANLRAEEKPKLKPAAVPAAPAAPAAHLALRPAPSPPVPGMSAFAFSAAAAPRPPLRAAAVPPAGSAPPAASVPRPFSLSRRVSFLSPPFRPLHIPVSVIAAFARLAMPNTMRDIETCAVLAGTLSRSTLRVTHCILPPQTATASTCSATDELSLLSCQSRLDLLTLGWIHTHPSQSLFLSSVDLHTQYGYQVMLQEAVAIVVTGRGEDGIFSLGKDGLDALAACGKSGFHEHDTRPGVGLLYAHARHVVKEMQGAVTFIDLRKAEQAGAAAAGAGVGAAAPGARGRGSGGSSLYPGMRAAHAH